MRSCQGLQEAALLNLKVRLYVDLGSQGFLGIGKLWRTKYYSLHMFLYFLLDFSVGEEINICPKQVRRYEIIDYLTKLKVYKPASCQIYVLHKSF